MKLKIFFIGAALLLTSCGGATGYTKPFDVQKTDWVKGSANAPVTLIEYADMQCPSCAAYNPLVNELNLRSLVNVIKARAAKPESWKRVGLYSMANS